jgi:TRAP transporter TAXI family solute receptor
MVRGARCAVRGAACPPKPWRRWVLGALMLGAGCGGQSDVRFLSIATGGTGGVYYPYGGALAAVYTAQIPDLQVTAEVTGASVDNLKLIQQGRVDMAFTLADTLAEAVAGTGPFADSGPVDVKAMAVLYTNVTHLVALENSGITRVADLKGKVVGTGAPGSGTELIADRLLRAAGLDPRTDITRHALGASEGAGALKDGKLDALFWSGGLPTPAMQDLVATPGLGLRFVPQADLLPALWASFGRGLYREISIPSGSYRGLTQDVAVVGVENFLVVSGRLSADLVDTLTRTLFEARATLEAAHPEARHLSVPSEFGNAPAPYHEGARRYYQFGHR